jgi:hypothetical protein
MRLSKSSAAWRNKSSMTQRSRSKEMRIKAEEPLIKSRLEEERL